ncbi:pantetheine-phosphate adenylyltransferase [Anaerorhabdus furcosa]|uniref:Phosphopantetheine adenylyltransferase n=1 Tax=Anaerorhabdus furcosa TaxID=118967 RepID=A0A1T4N5C8_9FIRM|nr:pantetheine-phosphate adenylyltransferase [Anaerorhabdus furcosa]SJZ74442.1 Phosphopantetheine adenylyltransferase [Anaerorhabdus furcosa]
MKIACYPGSFDPITNGHLDIIKRASKMFDEVIVTIMVNPKKKVTFDQQERKEMIEKCTKDLPNVKVVVGEGLTVDFATKLNATALIRGIRAVADYEYELQQATANMMLNDHIETLFFVARPEFSFLSSSVAKEIAFNGGDISKFIPEAINDYVMKKFK